MRDAVLTIGAGLLQVPNIDIAHSLGLACIVSDRNPQAPAVALADAYLPADIYDTSAHLAGLPELQKHYRIVGVFGQGIDAETTVAEVAAYLGLPGIPPEVARACKNKARMRAILNDQPETAGPGYQWLGPIPALETRDLAQAREWAEAWTGGWRRPIMVKAVDNCASRGTHRVDRADGLPAALADAMANSTTGTALLEQYLDGAQQSVEILFDADGRCHRLNIVDRHFDGVMELGHVNPTRLGVSERNRLFEMTEAAAQALGVRFGAFKADTILTDGGPRILEVTARLSGGFDCQYTTPLATGRNFIRAAMALACGLPLDAADLEHKHYRYAAAWTAFPAPGRVTRIRPVAEVLQAQSAVRHLFLRVREGEVIPEYEHCAQRPLFVIADGAHYFAAMLGAMVGAKAAAGLIETEAI